MPQGSGLWNPNVTLILASKSASRRRLLESAGIPFQIDVAEIDERAVETAFVEQGGAGDGLASTLARAKAIEVSRRNPRALCLGADQTLSLEGRIFHKPAAMAEADRHLAILAGRTHQLTSAFAIARDGEVAHEDEDRARMTMRSLDARQIEHYLRCAGPSVLTSVGAYQLERVGVHLFERIEGDHFTILGLPLLKLLSWLRRQGAILI